MVLLRTAPCLQSPGCASISNISGAEESRSLHHQRSPRCSMPSRLRGGRYRTLGSRTRSRHPTSKGGQAIGVRIGNWLSAEQGKTLLQNSGASTLRGKRDRAILSVLLGCGLRRAELVALSVQDLQIREDHWVFADLIGKGKQIRTVPVPGWVKTALDDWTANTDITGGNIFRRVNKNGVVWGEGISPKAIWPVVRRAAQRAGIHGLAPHDLRRTCARLCHLAGGELEQIQFLLGHASVETTERYLGCNQKLRDAVNDQLGLEGV
jgi:site-specific recombinase XerD